MNDGIDGRLKNSTKGGLPLKKDSISQVKPTEVGPSFMDVSFLTRSSDVVQQLSAQYTALRTSTLTK